MTGIVVFASKYGSTREYASLIAKKLDTQALRASEATSEALLEADYVVLGSPIYAYSVLPDMEQFLEKNQEVLAGKPLAAFVVCGDTLWNPKADEGGNKNLIKLTRFLPSEPFAAGIFGGRMIMDELDEEDGPRILAFYKRLGREPTGYDRMNEGAALAFVEEVKKVLRDKR